MDFVFGQYSALSLSLSTPTTTDHAFNLETMSVSSASLHEYHGRCAAVFPTGSGRTSFFELLLTYLL